MTNAVVTINGAQPALPTLLGQGPVRIPAGGKIRAGIKVLTKKAAEHPKAKEIYERGVAANLSFDAIERAISDAVPELKTPLIPKNVPWFTVRPDDFSSPEIAAQILTAYGEDRGDGTKPAIHNVETIAFMRGGHISRFLDARRTSFFITKKLMEVPHIDEDGRAVRVSHWIIELEAPIDVTALLRVSDEDDTAIIN